MFHRLLCAFLQDNIKFLKTVASLSDVFKKQYNAPFPAPPVTWLVQDFELVLDPMTPDDYLEEVLRERGALDSDPSKQVSLHCVFIAYDVCTYVRM